MSTHSAWRAGLRQRCPQCGHGEVFEGYLKFRDCCGACGADFGSADSGDGPAVFVILIVGAIVAPLLIVLQFGLNLPGWLALTTSMGAAVALCVTLLPVLKSLLFALQWAHNARQATVDDLE
ncbi:MAG: DUF983 domain-containing protein [Hyphomonadaceae bacterium]|nr:DUF983 domain-containing protein [Hyphomonadaceae bacterium]